MRPIPRSRHLPAVLMLAVVAAAYGYAALYDSPLQTTQIHAATAALKHHNPALLEADSVFGRSGMWRLNLPVPQYLLSKAMGLTAHRDPVLPFRLATGVVALVYLTGMYVLLQTHCRSWSVSVFVAVLSSRITSVFGGAFWGAGSLGSTRPEGLCVALCPWLVLAFLHFRRHWALPVVFLTIGALANVHPPVAGSLALLLLLVYLGGRLLSIRRWLMFVICAAACIVAALPAAQHFMAVRAATAAGQSPTTASEAFAALRTGKQPILFGQILRASLAWLPLAVVLIAPSAAILVRAARFRLRHLGFWLGMLGASVVVSLGLHGLALLAAIVRDTPPATTDLARASSLIMLPLYVFFALSLTSLFRLVRRHRILVRGACALLLVGWLLPADNLRPVRHGLTDLATVFLKDKDKPRSVRRHRENRRKHHELTAIAAWAQQNTPPTAVFLTDRIEFRMHSGRAIVAAREDLSYFYRLAPGRLAEWRRRVEAQRKPLAGGTGLDSAARLIGNLKADGAYRGVSQWYAILRSGAKVEGLQEVPGKMWGRAYRLYRLP